MRPLFEIKGIRLIEPEDYKTLLASSAPGDVRLFGPMGRTGGLLRLTSKGEFMVLSKDQLYLQAPIRWPWSRQLFILQDGRLSQLNSAPSRTAPN
jgi:hypothetical protein